MSANNAVYFLYLNMAYCLLMEIDMVSLLLFFKLLYYFLFLYNLELVYIKFM